MSTVHGPGVLLRDVVPLRRILIPSPGKLSAVWEVVEGPWLTDGVDLLDGIQ